MQLGFWELSVILVIVLVLFGAGRLPEVFSALGQGVKKFREAQMDDSPAPAPPRQLDDAAGRAEKVQEAEEVSSKQAAGQ